LNLIKQLEDHSSKIHKIEESINPLSRSKTTKLTASANAMDSKSKVKKSATTVAGKRGKTEKKEEEEGEVNRSLSRGRTKRQKTDSK
jgi:hypothetical protein